MFLTCFYKIILCPKSATLGIAFINTKANFLVS